MSAKREFFDKAVAELNLDVRDPFTLLFANACALLDQRDELKREVAELRDKTIEECAKAAESYPWVDDDAVQGPEEHQAALAKAIRALKGKP